MSKFEKYLKERNIPVNSLEANSIREGIQWTINTAVEWVKNRDICEKYLHHRTSLIDDYADALRKYLEE